MRNIAKKLSIMTVCTLFATMQMASAAIDTGLQNAQINHADGGFKGVGQKGPNASLEFNGNAHVNWDSLNVGKNESLDFNAVDGKTGITVVNTVNKGMTEIYGTIRSNSGISKLIISNPNGLLFDGATFETAGNLMLTTQALDVKYVNGNIEINGLNQEATNGVTIKNSDFTVGGEFNITAPTINAIKAVVKADQGFKLITADGQNYLVAPKSNVENIERKTAVRLESVSVNGDVYITSGRDIVKIVNGGTIDGNLTVNTDGNVALNYVNNGNKLHVTGDVTVESDGRTAYLRNADVDGNLKMSNSGGFLEINNVNVGKNADLKTTVKTNEDVKHFIHVVGDTTVGGNLNIDSIHNIHIGGYNSDLKTMKDGSLKVGGDLNAVAHKGTVAVTVDTEAKNISLESGTLNIITDGKAQLKANTYKFKANRYIGGVDDPSEIIDVMENYKPLPTVNGKSYVNIAGGDVTKLETADNGYAFIHSEGNMTVNGVKANKVSLSANQADIQIKDDVHADLIQVEGDTKNLTVELPSRDYTLKYTNIKDTEVITIDGKTTITYEMANGPEGWNRGTQTADNTYLVVPGPGNQPSQPGEVVPGQPNPPAQLNPQDNDNVKILNNLERNQLASAIDQGEVYTPVAFAADLDDEEDTGVRKNVDGSVTVVRPFTPSN